MINQYLKNHRHIIVYNISSIQMNLINQNHTSHISIKEIFSVYNQSITGCWFIKASHLKLKVAQTYFDNVIFEQEDNLSAAQTDNNVPMCIDSIINNKHFHMLIGKHTLCLFNNGSG